MAKYQSGSDKGSVLTGQPTMAVDPMRNPQGGPFKGRGEELGYFATGIGASLAAVFAAFPPRQAKKELEKASSALDAMPQDAPIGQSNDQRKPINAVHTKWGAQQGNTRGR